jgi:hypothetical protein
VKTTVRWIIGGAILAAFVAACGWLVLTDAPAYQFLVRLYMDKRFLKHTLREWGVLAPVIFMGLQALQVIIPEVIRPVEETTTQRRRTESVRVTHNWLSRPCRRSHFRMPSCSSWCARTTPISITTSCGDSPVCRVSA